MHEDVLYFFDKKQRALPLYEAFEQRVLSELAAVNVKAQKTQITFSNRHVFACASFLPVRLAADRPETYLVITFGLPSRLDSPRIDAAVEPYPNRWTHHVMIQSTQEIDDELMDWVRQAAAFSAGKR